jgi:23S rRNA-/tRNA-specific pseudouridylate synthase
LLKIREGDLIEHFASRIEPPVLDIPIEIIHEDELFLVVNKPPAMIVHTGGGYFYNTLAGILFFEHGKRNIHGIFIFFQYFSFASPRSINLWFINFFQK